MKNANKRHTRAGKVIKIISLIIAGLILLTIIVLFAVRGVNALKLRLPGGIIEKRYVELGGFEQFISIRGEDENNPVVIFLHGGPGSPVGFLSYVYQPALESDYTFIQWDQRGSGRTYYKSPDAPLSFENMLCDLDDLVDYAVARFHQPVYIIGHSWGTALGITYAAEHPGKIARYIGIGQMIDTVESGRLQADAAANAARVAGSDADAELIIEIFNTNGVFGEENFDFSKFVELSQMASRYLDPNSKNPTLAALVSPDFGWNDLRYQLLLMLDSTGHLDNQMPLLETLAGFKPPESPGVPSAFIGGQRDYVCSTILAKEYADSVHAPFYEMGNTGHAPMYDDPVAFAEVLKEALSGR